MDQAPTIRVIGFKTEYSRDKDGKARAIDWVEYAPVHAIMSNRVWARIEHMRPPEQIADDNEGLRMAFLQHRWAMIEKAYQAWKTGEEIPVDGTPLGMWPGINPEQAALFRKVGLVTVEDVATMPDALMSKIPMPNVRALKTAAAVFLEHTDRAEIASEMAALKERTQGLEEQLAAAMALLSERRDDEAPKHRGRAKTSKPAADAEEVAEEAEAA